MSSESVYIIAGIDLANFPRPHGGERAVVRWERASEDRPTPRPMYRAADYRNAMDDGPLSEPYRWHSIRRVVHIPTQTARWQAWDNHGPVTAPCKSRQDAIDWIDSVEGGPVDTEQLAKIAAARAEYERQHAGWRTWESR